MADQRILYTEKVVGAGHPTLSDTLNRLALVEHNSDGTHSKMTKVIDPYFDVRAYGTGRTDVEIQAAIDAASAAGGGTVLLEAATYTISTAVNIPDKVRLCGRYGMYSSVTILSCNVDGGNCVTMGDGATLVTTAGIAHLTIQAGTYANSTGLNMNYTRWCEVEQVKIINFTTGKGLRISGSTTGGNASIQNKFRGVYLGNNLVNLHLTGEDANNDSASDEGLFEDIRIQLSGLANSKGIYLERGSINTFVRTSVVDGSGPTSGAYGIYFDDGARSTSYASINNDFYSIYLELQNVAVHFEANTSGNVFHDFSGHGNTIPVEDNSGGANIIRYPTGGWGAAFMNMTYLSQTYQNLLLNSEFERWEGGTSIAPTGWTLSGAGASVARDAANQRKGTYCAAVTRAGADVDFTATVTPYNHLKGRWVVAGMWVKSSVASSVQLRINDGVGGTSGAYHTGGGAYEFLTVRRKIDASATYVQISLRVRTTDGTAYADAAVVQEGYELTMPVEAPALPDSKRLYHTFTYDPASLADGAGETTQVTVNGAALGDFVLVAAPYDLQDITVTGYVQAADTVEIRVQNESGGVIDLASGTWKVMVLKY